MGLKPEDSLNRRCWHAPSRHTCNRISMTTVTRYASCSLYHICNGIICLRLSSPAVQPVPTHGPWVNWYQLQYLLFIPLLLHLLSLLIFILLLFLFAFSTSLLISHPAHIIFLPPLLDPVYNSSFFLIQLPPLLIVPLPSSHLTLLPLLIPQILIHLTPPLLFIFFLFSFQLFFFLFFSFLSLYYSFYSYP